MTSLQKGAIIINIRNEAAAVPVHVCSLSSSWSCCATTGTMHFGERKRWDANGSGSRRAVLRTAAVVGSETVEPIKLFLSFSFPSLIEVDVDDGGDWGRKSVAWSALETAVSGHSSDRSITACTHRVWRQSCRRPVCCWSNNGKNVSLKQQQQEQKQEQQKHKVWYD